MRYCTFHNFDELPNPSIPESYGPPSRREGLIWRRELLNWSSLEGKPMMALVTLVGGEQGLSQRARSVSSRDIRYS